MGVKKKRSHEFEKVKSWKHALPPLHLTSPPQHLHLSLLTSCRLWVFLLVKTDFSLGNALLMPREWKTVNACWPGHSCKNVRVRWHHKDMAQGEPAEGSLAEPPTAVGIWFSCRYLTRILLQSDFQVPCIITIFPRWHASCVLYRLAYAFVLSHRDLR